MNDSWNDPRIWDAATQLIPQIMEGHPMPSIARATLTNNELALAHYLAHALHKITNMTIAELEIMRQEEA